MPAADLRIRPIAVGQLRAFLSVANHLNFRAAAADIALTQSAVSRQIQALEDEVGTALFLRHTRAVELTAAGTQLLSAATAALERIDGAVRQIRRSIGRRSVAVTTWASFASLWLIPRLEAFQRVHPDIDIRIDASDAAVDLETSALDLALRYTLPANAPPGAIRLFGEQLTVVASPWLLRSAKPVESAADLAQFTLIEVADSHWSRSLDSLTWQRWFDAHQLGRLEPRRWLYFNYTHQNAQAALAGQGVALARLPLVADSLRSGDLVEVLPTMRLKSPLAYWLIVNPRSLLRPEIKAFCDWLQVQAAETRTAIG